MNHKSHLLTLAAVLMVMVLIMTACESAGSIVLSTPSGGEADQGDPAPEEPVEAPPEPEQPVEAPPEEPAAPAPTQAPAESSGDVIAQGDLLKILIVLVIILLIIGVIMMIVAALGGGGKSQAPAPAADAPPPPKSVEDFLNAATPKATELYNRFTELVQTYGQVSIVPTQTRIDFRVRTILASVEFREDSLLVLLVLSERLESPRIIRVDTYTQSSFANYLYIRTLDDYDAEFSAWLQEAYNLGTGGV